LVCRGHGRVVVYGRGSTCSLYAKLRRGRTAHFEQGLSRDPGLGLGRVVGYDRLYGKSRCDHGV